MLPVNLCLRMQDWIFHPGTRAPRRRMLKNVATVKKLIKRPPPTKQHKQRRIEWAKSLKKVCQKDLSKVVFTDEWCATLDGPKGFKMVLNPKSAFGGSRVGEGLCSGRVSSETRSLGQSRLRMGSRWGPRDTLNSWRTTLCPGTKINFLRCRNNSYFSKTTPPVRHLERPSSGLQIEDLRMRKLWSGRQTVHI